MAEQPLCPTLRAMCIATLCRSTSRLGDLGWLEAADAVAILQYCESPEDLAAVEDATLAGSGRELTWYTWHIWAKIYASKYGPPPATADLQLGPLPGEPPLDYAAPAARWAQGDWRGLYEAKTSDIAARMAALRGRLRGSYAAEELAKAAASARATDKLPPAKRGRGGGGGGGGAGGSGRGGGGPKIMGKSKAVVMKDLLGRPWGSGSGAAPAAGAAHAAAVAGLAGAAAAAAADRGAARGAAAAGAGGAAARGAAGAAGADGEAAAAGARGAPTAAARQAPGAAVQEAAGGATPRAAGQQPSAAAHTHARPRAPRPGLGRGGGGRRRAAARRRPRRRHAARPAGVPAARQVTARLPPVPLLAARRPWAGVSGPARVCWPRRRRRRSRGGEVGHGHCCTRGCALSAADCAHGKTVGRP
ncbi:MAG: hypothetical protein J3K34DRAFT_66352 [Monoraphidium minutum]|nr:MAG: hypothetical protein J3K34DRAFT_66352 [Monoraphidium minutum]